MKRPRHQRPDATGRSEKTERFVLKPYPLLSSPAYRSLSRTARCLIDELAMLSDGKNNGEIWLTLRDAAALLDCDVRTAAKAFAELRAAGFIAVTGARSTNNDRGRPTNTYRLTFQPVIGKMGATNEWRDHVVPPDRQAAIAPAMAILKRRQKKSDMVQNPTKPPQLNASSAQKHEMGEESSPQLSAPNDIETLSSHCISRGPICGKLHHRYISPSTRHATADRKDKLRTRLRSTITPHGGLSQNDVAARSGISAPKLSRFKNDQRNGVCLTEDQADALERALNELDEEAKKNRPSRRSAAAA